MNELSLPLPITPVSEIATWLHDRSATWRALAMLRAYFDESGTQGTPDSATSIAGYVATEEVWTELEVDWAKQMAPYVNYGVTTFHMRECLAGVRQYERLDSFWRNQHILDMGNVLTRHDIQPVWSAVVAADWALVTDADFLARYPKPFDLCFEHTLVQLWEWAQQNTGGEAIAPMFALSKEYLPRMQDVGSAYLASEWYHKFLRPLSFGPCYTSHTGRLDIVSGGES